MEEVEDLEFTFTWIIENFSMCHQSNRQFYYSPGFMLDSVPGIKWHIKLYPRGVTYQNYLTVYFQRNGAVPGNYNIRFNYQVLDCNEKLIYNSKECLETFRSTSCWGFSSCFETNSHFRSLVNDILIIKYSLKIVCDKSEQDLLPPLSYENGLFTDVVLRAGDAFFDVHKAILWTRWPKLVEKLDAKETCEQVLDIKSNVLDAMIQYVYTGKIDCTRFDLFPELYTAAAKYELPNLQYIPVVAQKARTRIDVTKISFEWPIQNFSSLPINTILYSHVFSVDILKSCRWSLIFYMREDAVHGRIFDIFICKIYENKSKPIFVRSKISLDESDSSENTHLFKTTQSWKCAEFSRTISTDPNDTLLLNCELKFSDCNSFSEILEFSCAFKSSTNCRYFNTDLRRLYRSGALSDINIVVGSKTFPVHKSILCARSPVFSRMFESNMIESEKNEVEISDVDPDIVDEMLVYMYSGNLDKPLKYTAEQLYAAADKYDVPSLKKKCSSFLQSNLTAENVCKVLLLASMHCDGDLYKSVFEFCSAHVEEVFSTDEWNGIANDNLWVKLVQDILVRKNAEK